MKLHIGCGSKYLEGYKHVDIMQHDHIDYVTSADNLSMIESNSIEEIYAAHILEHFHRDKIVDVLKEWNRVLVVGGGVIRIAVPDFEAIAQEYLLNNNLQQLLGLLYGGQNYEYNFHYITFDFQSLKIILEKAGFSNIKRYSWQEFLPEGYDDFSRAYLPHMDFENGRLMSLNIVAKKVY